MTIDIVPTAVISKARALQERTFDLTAMITREVMVDDGAGGELPGTPETYTFPCRISEHKSASGERVVAGAIEGASLFDITVPALTDIRLGDDITIVFSATDTRHYEVMNMSAPKSRETARVVLAQQRAST